MSDDTRPITAVLVRKWRDNGDVIALFPELPSDYLGHFVDSYMHVGQHGGADYHGVIQATTAATAEDAADLIRELERIGYRLKVIKRASRRVHEARRKTAKSVR